jgi:hypothetical protein|tara:strand:- start:167 stop:352 length:186 start_codon:yes stop_codon:yes gene_type:complete
MDKMNLENFYIRISKLRTMKNFYWFTTVAVVLTVLAVLFFPGVEDFVERTFQRYLGQAARQ